MSSVYFCEFLRLLCAWSAINLERFYGSTAQKVKFYAKYDIFKFAKIDSSSTESNNWVVIQKCTYKKSMIMLLLIGYF